MVSLRNVKEALDEFNVDIGEINRAIDALHEQLYILNNVEVRGRDRIDKLFGCMLAIEAILGEGNNG